MLDPALYRLSESLGKQQIPSWRYSQIHHVDHFDKEGFPVRVQFLRDVSMLVDTMQENRFVSLMEELGGLTAQETDAFVNACADAVRFQLTYFPDKPPLIPLSTVMSALVIYNKIAAYNPEFRTLLEIGPGCGYLSFFLRHHAPLMSYRQVEACESFYLFQNLVNTYCFGHRTEDLALPGARSAPQEFFTRERSHVEKTPTLSTRRPAPLVTHYPWWRLHELAAEADYFDVVTSNANLLEFHPWALEDYLTLIRRTLNREGFFFVQCTGYPAHGNFDSLMPTILEHGFRFLFYVDEHTRVSLPIEERRNGDLLTNLFRRSGKAIEKSFAVNNVVMVRDDHPLVQRAPKAVPDRPLFLGPDERVLRMFTCGKERRHLAKEDTIRLVQSSI